MSHSYLIGLALVLVLGIGAQWLAWRLRQPSILLLLVAGFLAGPVTGVLEPDALFGGLLMPVISLSVAVILFEGGLSLQLREIEGISGLLGRLVLLGGAITLGIGAVAAHLILGLSWGMAALLGAVLVVSGPTVIMPILRHVRPAKRVSSLLKWEAMINDPLGVLVAVLIFEALVAANVAHATTAIAKGLLLTLVVGSTVGWVSARLVRLVLVRDWVPDYLHSPVTLMFVIIASVTADSVQPEAGLVAVTLMGAFLANQSDVTVRHIVEFKENLRVLLIAVLFVLLASRVTWEAIGELGLPSFAFLAVLLLVARPLSVFLSTLGSDLGWRERVFLGWMHPRGVVSAAISAVFALKLVEVGHEEATVLVPVTLLVIVGTIVAHGLPAAFLAHRLGLAQPNPQGVLIVGSSPWAQRLAAALKEAEIHVVLADSNWRAVAAARLKGLTAWYGDVLAERAVDEIELQGLGRLLALTPNDDVNSLAALHFAEVFGRDGVYQLPPSGSEGERPRPRHLRGRLLWGKDATHETLRAAFEKGEVRSTPLTEEFDFESFMAHHGGEALPLFIIDEGRLRIMTARNAPAPQPGHVIVAVVPDGSRDEESPERVVGPARDPAIEVLGIEGVESNGADESHGSEDAGGSDGSAGSEGAGEPEGSRAGDDAEDTPSGIEEPSPDEPEEKPRPRGDAGP